MSLRTIHVVYGCGVVTVAVLLMLANTLVHHCAAVIVLLVAVPWFRVLTRTFQQESIDKSEYTVDAILADFDQNDGHRYRPAQDQG